MFNLDRAKKEPRQFVAVPFLWLIFWCVEAGIEVHGEVQDLIRITWFVIGFFDCFLELTEIVRDNPIDIRKHHFLHRGVVIDGPGEYVLFVVMRL